MMSCDVRRLQHASRNPPELGSEVLGLLLSLVLVLSISIRISIIIIIIIITITIIITIIIMFIIIIIMGPSSRNADVYYTCPCLPEEPLCSIA